jgi:hypothetical protein
MRMLIKVPEENIYMISDKQSYKLLLYVKYAQDSEQILADEEKKSEKQ